MKMAPGAIPNPGRVPEQELLSLELGFLVATALGCVSGENLRCTDVFRSGEKDRRRGDARRWTRRRGGAHARPSLGRAWVPPGGYGPLPDLSF